MEKLIYIADDEVNILNLIKSFLKKEGFKVKAFTSADDLLSEFYFSPCDLVILDIMMQGVNGLAASSIIRNISTVPIIMVSAKDSETDKVTAMNLGCDDYMTKPFSPIELIARIKSIFRRIELDKEVAVNKNIVKFSDMLINKSQRSIRVNNEEKSFTNNEFEILIYLIEHSDRAVSREELLRKVWNFRHTEIETRATDDAVKRLRRKLLDSGSLINIKTIRGFGFRIFGGSNE